SQVFELFGSVPSLVLAVILLANAAALLSGIYFAAAFIKRLTPTEKMVEDARSRGRKEAEQIVSEARSQEQKILVEAGVRSAQMISEMKTIISLAEEKIQQIFRDFARVETEKVAHASEELFKVFGEKLNEMNEAYDIKIRDALDIAVKKADQEILNFSKLLLSDVKKENQIMAGQIKELYGDFEKDIMTHKKALFSRIDEMIKRTADIAIKEAFRDALTPEEHRKLVMQALKEAKKEDFFKGIAVK
ncbi:MAG: hypothetical protein AAB930_01880, partial [Patescibacteria group bacterium]